jgi:Domain of unknown function (DUF4389)
MSQEGTPQDSPGNDYYESEHFEGRPSVEKNLKSTATWLRLLFMIIMAAIFWIACIVAGAVIIIQFFWVLFAGEPKAELKHVGRQLAAYAAEICLYLTFNTDERPFPFDLPWPAASDEAPAPPPDA